MRSKDAIKPHKYIPLASGSADDRSKLIGIVGFGNFSQFLAKTMVRQGHTVLAYSRTDYSDIAEKLGVSYFFDADDFYEEHQKSFFSIHRFCRLKKFSSHCHYRG